MSQAVLYSIKDATFINNGTVGTDTSAIRSFSQYNPSLTGYALFMFDTSSIPSNAEITSAILSLDIFSVSTNNPAFTIQLVISPWSETSYSDVSVVYSPIGNISNISTTSITNIDVTSLITWWYKGDASVANYGFRIVPPVATKRDSLNECYVRSKESTVGTEPKLTINYTTPAPTNQPPTQFDIYSPNGEGIVSGNDTVMWQASTDPEGGAIVYDVWLTNNSLGINTILGQHILATSCPVDYSLYPPDTNYSISVNAIDDYGGFTNSVVYFTIEASSTSEITVTANNVNSILGCKDVSQLAQRNITLQTIFIGSIANTPIPNVAISTSVAISMQSCNNTTSAFSPILSLIRTINVTTVPPPISIVVAKAPTVSPVKNVSNGVSYATNISSAKDCTVSMAIVRTVSVSSVNNIASALSANVQVATGITVTVSKADNTTNAIVPTIKVGDVVSVFTVNNTVSAKNITVQATRIINAVAISINNIVSATSSQVNSIRNNAISVTSANFNISVKTHFTITGSTYITSTISNDAQAKNVNVGTQINMNTSVQVCSLSAKANNANIGVYRKVNIGANNLNNITSALAPNVETTKSITSQIDSVSNTSNILSSSVQTTICTATSVDNINNVAQATTSNISVSTTVLNQCEYATNIVKAVSSDAITQRNINVSATTVNTSASALTPVISKVEGILLQPFAILVNNVAIEPITITEKQVMIESNAVSLIIKAINLSAITTMGVSITSPYVSVNINAKTSSINTEVVNNIKCAVLIAKVNVPFSASDDIAYVDNSIVNISVYPPIIETTKNSMVNIDNINIGHTILSPSMNVCRNANLQVTNFIVSTEAYACAVVMSVPIGVAKSIVTAIASKEETDINTTSIVETTYANIECNIVNVVTSSSTIINTGYSLASTSALVPLITTDTTISLQANPVVLSVNNPSISTIRNVAVISDSVVCYSNSCEPIIIINKYEQYAEMTMTITRSVVYNARITKSVMINACSITRDIDINECKIIRDIELDCNINRDEKYYSEIPQNDGINFEIRI